MPTSGGTGDTDPFARCGIGDGPEETAGENARAAGMVETEKMIEDNKNSLIDAVDDSAMVTARRTSRRRIRERMVAAGKVDVIQFHGKLPRQPPPEPRLRHQPQGTDEGDRKPESQKARGLFEVQGRTPLHVRVVAYESYDTGEKRWLEARKPEQQLIELAMDSGRRRLLDGAGPLQGDAGWYLVAERHQAQDG